MNWRCEWECGWIESDSSRCALAQSGPATHGALRLGPAREGGGRSIRRHLGRGGRPGARQTSGHRGGTPGVAVGDSRAPHAPPEIPSPGSQRRCGSVRPMLSMIRPRLDPARDRLVLMAPSEAKMPPLRIPLPEEVRPAAPLRPSPARIIALGYRSRISDLPVSSYEIMIAADGARRAGLR